MRHGVLRASSSSAAAGAVVLLALKHGHRPSVCCDAPPRRPAHLLQPVVGVASARASLRSEGFCVLAPPMAISTGEARELIGIVAEGRELSRRAEREASGRPRRMGFLQVLRGRYHANLLYSAVATDAQGSAGLALGAWHDGARSAMDVLAARFAPLVDAFFEAEGGAAARSGYFLSQLQLLDVEPGCAAQFFHRDNVAPGLTLIVPLVPVLSGDRGPTELLVRSHTLSAGGGGGEETGAQAVLQTLQAARRHKGAAQALCAAGDVLAFDSRVLHRGASVARSHSSSADQDGLAAAESDDPDGAALWAAAGAHRPALVFRWDAIATPPPGVGVLGTLLQRCTGRIFEGVGSLIADGDE